MFDTDRLETRVVASIAAARGDSWRAKDDRWPDGWIGARPRDIPVEVVSAFPDKNGEAWARAFAGASRKASRIKSETEGVSWCVVDGVGIVLNHECTAPVSCQPHDPIAGVMSAITRKAQKYGPSEIEETILGVHMVQWPWLLMRRELERIAAHARSVSRFREVWIVNEFGDPAQRAA
jgi:hypothetical protein